MEKSLKRMDMERSAIYTLFFIDLKWYKKVEYESEHVLFYLMDQVSKDLGVPFHQIKPEHVKDPTGKGHEPASVETWRQKPTEQE